MSKKIVHKYIFSPGENLRKDILVFMDRDGVVIEEKHLLHRAADVTLLPGAASAIKRLNEARIPIIVASNQTAIARGLCDADEMDRIHMEMERQLKDCGARVDGIFYCPHSREADRPAYRIDCDWRKPKAGMLRKALTLLGGKRTVFVIGDMARDVLAGQTVGATTILVKTGHGGKDQFYRATSDFIVEDLFEAVCVILKKEQ